MFKMNHGFTPLRLIIRRLTVFWLFLTRPFLKRKHWPVLLVVNSGSKADNRSYFSPSFNEAFLGKTDLYPIGHFPLPNNETALLLGCPSTFHELAEDKQLVEDLITETQSWNAKTIALLGQLPSVANRHKVWPKDDPRFMDGQLGTSSMIRMNVLDLFEMYPETSNKPVAIVGAGYTGYNVANDLIRDHRVVVFDKNKKLEPQFVSDDVVYAHDHWESLDDCGIVILLTQSGDDGIKTIYPYLRSHHVLLSDTHPRPTKIGWDLVRERKSKAYVCGTSREGAQFTPQLPGWKPNNLPGCALEAVVTYDVDEKVKCVDTFIELARGKGLASDMDHVHS